MNPCVSIIVPCFNQSQYLSEVLQSVLDQNYQNWECIIVNDGSPDDTEKVAKVWLTKDARFKYIYKENGGLSSARNAGIEIAKGTFILPLDADDLIATHYLALAMIEFEKDDSLKVVYCKAEKFGAQIGEWQLPNFSLENLAIDNMIFCSAVFSKKDCDLVDGFDVNMVYGLEDWEFWISLLKNGGKVKCLDHVGFYYRIKENSMLQNLDQIKKKYLFDYLSIKHADFFVKHLGSFIYLKDANNKQKIAFNDKLKSKKFVVKLFINAVFSFFKIK